MFIEFLLVGALFGLIVMFFLDAMHYYSARAVLMKGARDAVALAIKHEAFHSDLTDELPADPAKRAEEYRRFIEAREEIAAEAIRFPLATMVGSVDSGAAVELTSFSVEDHHAGGTGVQSGLPAAILRPGERFLYESSNEELVHPFSGNEGESMQSKLRRFPVIVQLSANKNLFFSFFGTSVPIRVSAVAWIQQYPKSGYEIEAYLPERGSSGRPDDEGVKPEDTWCDDPGDCEYFNEETCICCNRPPDCVSPSCEWDYHNCQPRCSNDCPHGHNLNCTCRDCYEVNNECGNCAFISAPACSCDWTNCIAS